MSVCKFYLSGSCRYGSKCWNIHPNDGGYNAQRDYYNNTNDKNSWKSSGPPRGTSPPAANVPFSFNKALAASNNKANYKPNLFSVNRYGGLSSDDEDMEDGYSGNTSPSHRFGSSGNVSQFKWTKEENSNQGRSSSINPPVGLFGKSVQSTPIHIPQSTFSLSHLGKSTVAPQHAGLFKPKETNQQVAPQHAGLFKPKETNQPSSNVVPFSFAPSQFKTNVNVPHSNQNLFGRESFGTKSSNVSLAPSSGHQANVTPTQPGTLFGKPVASQPTTLFGKPVAQPISQDLPMKSSYTASVPKSVLSVSSWLVGLGNSVYSSMNELKPMERESFQAGIFELINVPLVPPPRELCH